MYLQPITTREQEVLHLISHEFRTQDIADKLYITQNTVETHRRNLLCKLDVRNTAGLVRKGFELGYLHVVQQRNHQLLTV